MLHLRASYKKYYEKIFLPEAPFLLFGWFKGWVLCSVWSKVIIEI